MSLDYPTIMATPKSLIVATGWETADEQGRQKIMLSVEIDGLTIEGLSLRATANRRMVDRKVTIQLEHRPPGAVTNPLCRIEWRPIRPHRNYGRGPIEHRWIDIPESHIHSFDLNWHAREERMLADNLPIAVPIVPDPEGFRELLALVSDEFRISNASEIPMPVWDMML